MNFNDIQYEAETVFDFRINGPQSHWCALVSLNIMLFQLTWSFWPIRTILESITTDKPEYSQSKEPRQGSTWWWHRDGKKLFPANSWHFIILF